MSVQRWGFMPYDGSEIEDPDGDWVKYEDYLDLQLLLIDALTYVRKTAADVANVDVDPYGLESKLRKYTE
jgi:hypothetical protein